MANSLRANVAKAIHTVWKDKGRPDIVSAQDVLEHYRQVVGAVTAKLLGEELHMMEDDSSSPMPFLRVNVPNKGGELGYLGLTDIDPDVLRILAGVQDEV